MSDAESNQASIDASDASIPAGNGSREAENAPPPSGRDVGFAASTWQQPRLRHAEGRQEFIGPNWPHTDMEELCLSITTVVIEAHSALFH